MIKKVNIKKKKDEKKNLKINKLKADNLIKFINSILKTSYKYNEKKNNLLKICINSDYKWDSLSHVKLLNALEKKFKIKINNENFDQFNNSEKMYRYLENKKLL